jgi:peptidoglycan/LPS O-acetylase OafA/YrhL
MAALDEPSGSAPALAGAVEPDSWRHRPTLDGVRGVGVLLILVHHTYSNLIPVRSSWGDPFPGSFIGVDIFFGLSGFLITSLLLREERRNGSVKLRRFYARRALRLLPALYVLIAAYVAYAALTNERLTLIGVLATATYWQNFARGGQIPAGFTHLWSLAVEEQFYLVWPVFLMALMRARRWPAVVPGALVALLVAMNVYRFVEWRGPISVFTFYPRPYTHGDALIVGALAAWAWVNGIRPSRALVPAAWISVAFLGLCVARYGAADRFYYLGGFTLVGIATSVIILASLQTSWIGGRLFELRPLCVLGRVSYGLYLWHYPIFLAVQRYTHDWTTPERLVLAFTLTAAVTAASWNFVERPFLRWKDRFSVAR